MLPILIYNIANYSKQFHKESNSPIPVYNLANMGKGTKILAGLRSKSKSKILKTWGVSEICLDMGSRI